MHFFDAPSLLIGLEESQVVNLLVFRVKSSRNFS